MKKSVISVLNSPYLQSSGLKENQSVKYEM